MSALSGVCACCGCALEPYEVFSARLRGLKKPVCLGCAHDTVAFLLNYLYPMTEEALKQIIPEK